MIRSVSGSRSARRVLLVALVTLTHISRVDSQPGEKNEEREASPSVGASTRAQNGDRYTFLANRRTIWAIDREAGRFAGYEFPNDRDRRVDRTRVASLNRRDFPRDDTVFLLSDRSQTEVLWICNRRTGDIQLWSRRVGGEVAGDVTLEINEDLGEGKPGDYLFLANRRTIWAINTTSGRFAGYHFRDDEERTINRTQVVEVDRKKFPVEDTVYRMSSRSLTELIWVCNRKTGAVELWKPRLGGEVVRDKQQADIAKLGEGTSYRFLANSSTIWVVNLTTSKFCGFTFEVDESPTATATATVDLDPDLFPGSDTTFLTSDRSLTELIWVANRKSAAVKLWVPRLSGKLQSSLAFVPKGHLPRAGTEAGGRHLFLANRHRIWVVDPASGQFASYGFEDLESHQITRSKVARVDPRDFPPSSTSYVMSDRNLAEVIWVCNRKTGDIQLWRPFSGGKLVGEEPLATAEDLRRK